MESCSAPPFCYAVRKKHDKQQHLYQKRRTTNLPFPKSRPNPIIPDSKLEPQTKLQALETVINKLESSLSKGISIDDPQIFASLLETCFQVNAIDHGLKLHRLIPDKLIRKNVGISSKLMRLYVCKGDLEKAHEMFDVMPERNASAFTWNSLISGYAEAGLYEDALALYFQMMEEGVEPDEYTFPRVLKACGRMGMIRVGEEVHRNLIRHGFGTNSFVLNAVVDMYAKCGGIDKSWKVFITMKNKDIVSWNSMILGFINHGLVSDALHTLQWMISEGFAPDSVTLSSLVSNISIYKMGTEIHGWVLRRGMDLHLPIANSLMVFYSNFNKLGNVSSLFNTMSKHDVVSWNSIISAHSKDPSALDYFNRMIQSNVIPDDVTFVLVLSACAHSGMVKDGERLFSLMSNKYQIVPSIEHYGCMVNLYARAGYIDEAYDFIMNRMKSEYAGASVWGALLYGCYLHGNARVGKIAADHLFDLEPEGVHNFDLLIKIYRSVGRHREAEEVEEMMRERGL